MNGRRNKDMKRIGPGIKNFFLIFQGLYDQERAFPNYKFEGLDRSILGLKKTIIKEKDDKKTDLDRRRRMKKLAKNLSTMTPLTTKIEPDYFIKKKKFPKSHAFGSAKPRFTYNHPSENHSRNSEKKSNFNFTLKTNAEFIRRAKLIKKNFSEKIKIEEKIKNEKKLFKEKYPTPIKARSAKKEESELRKNLGPGYYDFSLDTIEKRINRFNKKKRNARGMKNMYLRRKPESEICFNSSKNSRFSLNGITRSVGISSYRKRRKRRSMWSERQREKLRIRLEEKKGSDFVIDKEINISVA